MAEYPIIEVPSGSAKAAEPLGAKPKFWFDGQDGLPWLCKIVRPNTGEDWAEIVAAGIAQLLDLPHAHYVFGEYEGRRCVLSRTMVPPGASLIHGDELLSWLDPNYPVDSAPRHYAEPSHTLEAVFQGLERIFCAVPFEWRSKAIPRPADGVDCFAGYIILDALIGNTDRHHQNWAVIRHSLKNWHIAPTFDHASCLGRELSDEVRERRLQTKDSGFTPEAYAERALSGLFSRENTNRPLQTVEAVSRLSESHPRITELWLNRLAVLPAASFVELLSALPSSRFSAVARDFALRVLMHNRDRLLALVRRR